MSARWGAVTVGCRWEQYVHLRPTEGAPALAFQRVDARTPGKNALHLDVHVDGDVEPVVAQAVALGGQVLERVEQDDARWVVLLDPEGNRFCVVAVSGAGT